VFGEHSTRSVEEGIPKQSLGTRKKFNAKHNNIIEPIYGTVTTGSNWKFLKLTNQTLFIQSDETSIEHIERILGMFIKMIS